MNSLDITSFNEGLLKLLCSENNHNNETCLITDEILETDYITLSCNHKFNYKAIFNEIKQQKTRPHPLETQKLKIKDIKCPYCRNIQHGVLPSRYGFNNITGVNWPKKYQYLPNTCIYKFVSGKKKNLECGKKCSKKYCTTHEKIIKKRIEKQTIKKKQLIKNKNPDENKKINVKTGIPTCSYVYKRGKKAGENCSCKKPYPCSDFFDKTVKFLCKTHYKQINKNKTPILTSNIVYI